MTLSKAEVIQNYADANDWNVEQADDDGACHMAIFTGPDAEKRAREYAAWRNAGDGWRPITTAPIGEMFIYCLAPREGRRPVGLAYRAKNGGWRDSEGNWKQRLDPLYWMPLPQPK